MWDRCSATRNSEIPVDSQDKPHIIASGTKCPDSIKKDARERPDDRLATDAMRLDMSKQGDLLLVKSSLSRPRAPVRSMWPFSL